MNGPRILTLDIETAPNLAHVWGLWQQNVSLVQLRESASLLCAAAKWRDERTIQFYSGYGMVGQLHKLLDEADATVTYNGDQFDLPHLNREFIEAGLAKPSPYLSIDLLKVVRRNFRFPSNKLDYVTGRLIGVRKIPHAGHQLWIDCMAGDETAWKTMRRYNENDVRIEEKLYGKLLPWIPSHPPVPLYGEDGDPDSCPNCAGSLQRRGWAYTTTSRYPRFHCTGCGKWSRGGRRDAGMGVR